MAFKDVYLANLKSHAYPEKITEPFPAADHLHREMTEFMLNGNIQGTKLEEKTWFYTLQIPELKKLLNDYYDKFALAQPQKMSLKALNAQLSELDANKDYALVFTES